MNAGGLPPAGRVRRVKLAVPPPPPDAIARPALLARLDDAANRPLIRVVAGAGYGKTTLLAQWARHTTMPVAWLSLDPEDADLGRFAAHLAASIALAAPGSLPGVGILLAGSRALDPATLAEVLADDLLDLEDPVALVLDDLHAIAGSPAERMLDFLLVYPPPMLRLMAGSRSVPDLPQADRLSWRGLATNLGAADLRFAPEETATLLHDGDLRVAVEVTRRADGWAAGIRALAMAGAAGAGGATIPMSVHSLLNADVLAGQSPELVAFLGDLVVAERVSPALAAALSTRDLEVGDAAGLLAEAERHGLFVSRLDDRGEWWRLHPLLREALGGDGQGILAAHARASAWLARAGMPEEAIDHAIKAERLDEAGALLADHSAA